MRSIGIERALRFRRHLPEFGYGVRVLTTSAFGSGGGEEVLRAWEPLGLYRRLFNPAARAGRADSSLRTNPGPLGGLVRWARRFVLVPDGQIAWVPAALLCALRQLRRHPADVLYSTYPPASAHLLGLALKEFTGLPWVADFRDSWTDDPLDTTLEEMPYRRALEKRLEESIVEGADAVVAATELSAEYLRRSYAAAAARVQVIANGFEPRELEEAGPEEALPAVDPLRLVHTGSFAHSHARRTPRPLFAALEALIAEDTRWARRLRLVLAGRLSPAEERQAEWLVGLGVVELRGALEHPAALALQRRAHALLLVDHARPWPASNIPGKFYEYLAARRPILALCGPGMVERRMRELQAGFCAPPEDVQAIRRALVELYEAFGRGSLHSRVRPEALRPFHCRALSGRLARCFDCLRAEHGAGGGARWSGCLR